jgi:hypothetical protein
MSLTKHHARWDWVSFVLTWFKRMLAGAQAVAARGIRSSRYNKLRRHSSVAGFFICIALLTVSLVAIYHVYLDRTNLPDLEPFVSFNFPTIGHVYDINDQPLVELATEYRWISKYEEILR